MVTLSLFNGNNRRVDNAKNVKTIQLSLMEIDLP